VLQCVAVCCIVLQCVACCHLRISTWSVPRVSARICGDGAKAVFVDTSSHTASAASRLGVCERERKRE